MSILGERAAAGRLGAVEVTGVVDLAVEVALVVVMGEG